MLLSLAHLQPISAAKCPSAPWIIHRVRPLSTQANTMAMEIGKKPYAADIVHRLLEHYRVLGSRQQEGNPNGGLWVCERKPKERALYNSLNRQVQHYGWGPAFDCLSILDDGGKNRTTYNRARKLYSDIKAFSDMVSSLAPKVLRNYGLQWENVFSSEHLAYRAPDFYRECNLAGALGHRRKGNWAVAAMLTNVSISIVMKQWDRGYFMEPISVDNKSMRHFSFSMPKCSNGNLSGFENGSATIATWGGRPSWSHFSSRRIEENPAIVEALYRGEHEKELVEDSDTVSNLAILLLPAVLALVPLALFHDVGLSLTYVYILVTDVVSVLPVAIKGTELLWYGSKKHYATVSYLYGAETAKDIAVAETWVASCGMKEFVQEQGIGLLTTALCAMIVGIVLEFITRWEVSKHKKRRDRFHEYRRANREPRGLLWYIGGKTK